VLPDPTADLHWCDWKGAITDVFSRNARQFPDRVCVVQSLPPPPSRLGDSMSTSEQERISFTYSDILKASNVLAHHLIMAGIQREEVVMVYAHRGVELVVAVIAILKAGATFSVIGARVYSVHHFVLIEHVLLRSCISPIPSNYVSSCSTTSWASRTSQSG